MEIQIDKGIRETLPNKLDEIEEYLSLNTIDKGRRVQYAIVDGLPIYGDYREFLQSNVQTIKSMQIITESIASLVKKTLVQTGSYIEEILEAIDRLFEDEEGKTTETIAQLASTLGEDIRLTIKTKDNVDILVPQDDPIRQYSMWKAYIKEVDHLSKLGKSLEEAIKKGKDLAEPLAEVINSFEEIKRAAEYTGNYMELDEQ